MDPQVRYLHSCVSWALSPGPWIYMKKGNEFLKLACTVIYMMPLISLWSCPYSFLLPLVLQFWLKIRTEKDATIFEAKSEYINGIILKGKLKLKEFFLPSSVTRETSESSSCVRAWKWGLQLSLAAHWWSLRLCPITSSSLSSLICGMGWSEWIIYKVLSNRNRLPQSCGAGGRWAFLLSGCVRVEAPSPHPAQLSPEPGNEPDIRFFVPPSLCRVRGLPWWTGLLLWAVL